MKELEELQAQNKHLVNKRKEGLLAIMQKHKIKVEGHGEVPEPIETFEKM
jgi:ATP-dependent RNA helicase DDX52/ROK1